MIEKSLDIGEIQFDSSYDEIRTEKNVRASILIDNSTQDKSITMSHMLFNVTSWYFCLVYYQLHYKIEMLIAYFLYCAADNHSVFMMMLCTQTELPEDTYDVSWLTEAIPSWFIDVLTIRTHHMAPGNMYIMFAWCLI